MQLASIAALLIVQHQALYTGHQVRKMCHIQMQMGAPQGIQQMETLDGLIKMLPACTPTTLIAIMKKVKDTLLRRQEKHCSIETL